MKTTLRDWRIMRMPSSVRKSGRPHTYSVVAAAFRVGPSLEPTKASEAADSVGPVYSQSATKTIRIAPINAMKCFFPPRIFTPPRIFIVKLNLTLRAERAER